MSSPSEAQELPGYVSTGEMAEEHTGFISLSVSKSAGPTKEQDERVSISSAFPQWFKMKELKQKSHTYISAGQVS